MQRYMSSSKKLNSFWKNFFNVLYLEWGGEELIVDGEQDINATINGIFITVKSLF